MKEKDNKAKATNPENFDDGLTQVSPKGEFKAKKGAGTRKR